MPSSLCFHVLITILLGVLGIPASAQNWSGTLSSSTSYNWSDATNWTGGKPANNGTAKVAFNLVNTTSNPNLNANWNISTLIISGSRNLPFQIKSNLVPPATLTIQNGLTMSETPSQLQSIPPNYNLGGLALILPKVQTWNVTTQLGVQGIISGAGGINLTGGGLLFLDAGSTYTGGTTINASSVAFVDDSSFGNITGHLTLNGGNIIFNSDPITFSRDIILGTTGGTVTISRNLTLSGSISGSGPLTLIRGQGAYGSETVLLTGHNTFTGGLTISDGIYANGTENTWNIVVPGTDQGLGNGPVTLSVGTNLTINAASNIGAGKKILIAPQTALILANDTIIPSQVVDSASSQGYLEMSGTTYNQSLDMSTLGDGTLVLGVAGGKTVVYGGLTLKAGAGNIYRFGQNFDGMASTLVIGGRDNILSGNAAVVSNGGLQLLNANNYTGGTTGSLAIGNDNALGTGVVKLGLLQALNGLRTVSNPISIATGATLIGPFTLNGPVDLGGGTPPIFVNFNGSVTFANVISNGVFYLNGGTAILQAKNTFSGLQIYGGTVSVASETQLGGGSTPIIFAGIANRPASTGTLEVTSSFALTNPIGFFSYNGTTLCGAFQVDQGVTLSLTHAISGGSILKTGPGSLYFSGNASLNGSLYIDGGSVTSSGNALANSFLEIDAGGTFLGTGNVGWLGLAGSGVVIPGHGTGALVVSACSVGGASSDLKFEFTIKGSPIYTNMANSGNGLLAFLGVTLGSGGSFTGRNISIYLGTPTAQVGDSFKGALYVTSPSVDPVLLTGANFHYFVVSPTGATNFNGQKYAPLDLTKYSITQSWVAEPAAFGNAAPVNGQVLQFTIVPTSVPTFVNGPPPTMASLQSYYSFNYQAGGGIGSSFSLASGKLPPGLTLSASGILTGLPTRLGSYTGTIRVKNSVGSTTQNFFIVVPGTYSDWTAAYFTQDQRNNPSVSDYFATPQNDGIPNLMKYLLDIDPSVPMKPSDRAALPDVGLAGSGASTSLTLTYRRNPAVLWISAIVETSTDLQTWQAVADSQISQIGADPVTGDPIMQAQVPATGTARFLRLRSSP